MDNLRKLDEQEIVARAKNYEERMKKIQEDALQYISAGRKERENGRNILVRYHGLRKEITQESNYLETAQGDICHISEVHEAYQNGLDDCKRNGFAHVTEKRMTYRIVSIMDEAAYRLTKELKFIGAYR